MLLLLLFFNIYLFGGWGAHVEVRGQTAGLNSLHLLRGSQGRNSGHQISVAGVLYHLNHFGTSLLLSQWDTK